MIVHDNFTGEKSVKTKVFGVRYSQSILRRMSEKPETVLAVIVTHEGRVEVVFDGEDGTHDIGYVKSDYKDYFGATANWKVTGGFRLSEEPIYKADGTVLLPLAYYGINIEFK